MRGVENGGEGCELPDGNPRGILRGEREGSGESRAGIPGTDLMGEARKGSGEPRGGDSHGW